jgi:hypothetical protein
MTDAPRKHRSALPILTGAAALLILSMGVRETFGLYAQPITRDVDLAISDFTLVLSVHNLSWGLQPVAGAVAARCGFHPVLIGGVALYITGLPLLAGAHGFQSGRTAALTAAGFRTGVYA